MRSLIPIEKQDVLMAIQGFLRQLLEAQVVDAVLVPMRTPTGAVSPALVSDAEFLEHADPLAPVMGLNAAPLAGRVSVREPRERVGVVLRPCELRALRELVKLQQASLEDLVTIGVDCLGTYDVSVYNAMRDDGGVDVTDYLATATSGELIAAEGFTLRDGCQICERPHAEGADITLELFGADLENGIPITLPDDVAHKLGLSAVAADGDRPQIIEKLVAARTESRDQRFSEIRQQLDEEGVQGVLASCVRCHNCMTVCPICYCRTCLFRSEIFDHEPIQYANWARRKGVYRLPSDTMLFHLTRLNHMVLSCIGCGLCSSGCPADLPVGAVFRVIGQETQELFEYEPGRDVEEPLPLITFKEEEWMDVGEE